MKRNYKKQQKTSEDLEMEQQRLEIEMARIVQDHITQSRIMQDKMSLRCDRYEEIMRLKDERKKLEDEQKKAQERELFLQPKRPGFIRVDAQLLGKNIPHSRLN